MQKEIKRFKTPALMVCEVADVIGENAIVKTPNGNKFFVSISHECKNLEPGETVLAEQKNLTIIKKIDSDKKFDVEKFVIMEKPNLKWKDVGGLDKQIQEIKEVIELPLKKPKLFDRMLS